MIYMEDYRLLTQFKIIGVYSQFILRDIAETPAKCPLYGRDKAAEWAWTAVLGLYIHMYV